MYNILDLIELEIRTLFPDEYNKNYPSDNVYNLHCSKAVVDGIQKHLDSLITISVIEDTSIDKNIHRIVYPSIGTINIIEDMEQGYKILKIK